MPAAVPAQIHDQSARSLGEPAPKLAPTLHVGDAGTDGRREKRRDARGACRDEVPVPRVEFAVHRAHADGHDRPRCAPRVRPRGGGVGNESRVRFQNFSRVILVIRATRGRASVATRSDAFLHPRTRRLRF